MQLLRLLLGRPLASSEQGEHKVGVLAGVPALGLDALSSSAYGPEATLIVLASLGAASLTYIGPITLIILVLLGILYVSYRQTIGAYPNGGGSYTVAKENLGSRAGLLAAAALLLDYTLNVAVGISSGVGALTSAFPVLQPYTLLFCLATLVLITLVNLRGTVEAGWAFALPTYLFLISLGGVLLWGVARSLSHGGNPDAVLPPPALPAGAGVVSLWLILHAFASGCTAMTGVEAVSNGITAFRDPPQTHARRTLTFIVVVLAVLLAGIAYLVRVYRIGAMDQEQPGYQSVLSQLTGAVAGRGAVYYLTMTSLLAILALSANTSFTDFPRLCRLIAEDGYLPRGFAVVGRRLVFSVGILFLAGSSGLLLVAFGGITNALIPLFAVGAFLAFTLSQAGMVQHWRRQLADNRAGRAHAHVALWINGIGTVATGFALGIIILAKFREGAWIVIVAVPVLLALFGGIKYYYSHLESEECAQRPLELLDTRPPVVVLPAERWNKPVRQALAFGMRLSPDVLAVHLSALDPENVAEEEREIRRQWDAEVTQPAQRAGVRPPHLEIIESPYREFVDPLIAYLERIRRDFPGRVIAVILAEFFKPAWWQWLLHKRRGERLRTALLQQGGPDLVVIEIPWCADFLAPNPASLSEAPARGTDKESAA